LGDVLALVDGKAGLNIEVKSRGAGALTAAHLAGSGYKGEVLISSFKEREVLDARRVLPTVPVSGIFDDFSLSEVGSYGKNGYSFISLRNKTVTQELVVALHKQSIKVYVWTVDEEEEMKKLVYWGVDGIYSNKPLLLRKMVMDLYT
jgi:glycerophosphoryl diester phosphodiesterase